MADCPVVGVEPAVESVDEVVAFAAHPAAGQVLDDSSKATRPRWT
jgi:hypothetical protein